MTMIDIKPDWYRLSPKDKVERCELFDRSVAQDLLQRVFKNHAHNIKWHATSADTDMDMTVTGSNHNIEIKELVKAGYYDTYCIKKDKVEKMEYEGVYIVLNPVIGKAYIYDFNTLDWGKCWLHWCNERRVQMDEYSPIRRVEMYQLPIELATEYDISDLVRKYQHIKMRDYNADTQTTK